MNRLLYTSLIALFCCSGLFAQVGGQTVYNFLDLPISARITALGGNLITVQDDDAVLGYANPALLNASMHQQISFNSSIYFSGINYGYVSYAHHAEPIKTSFSGGIQYVNYGKFDAADETGLITGQFKASEYAISVGAGRKYGEKISYGANMKFVISQLESYRSSGLATDWGMTYADTSSRFSYSLVIRNLGFQFSPYESGNRENLPFDVQMGISKQLKHLPFRFSIIAHHLNRWNIRYDDPNVDDATILFGDGGNTGEKTYFFDKLFRHIIFNGEFLFGKKENFRVRLGYNHLRRGELSIPNANSLAGFTVGVGFKIKQIRIDYGYASYHVAGGANHFTISTNLNSFKR